MLCLTKEDIQEDDQPCKSQVEGNVVKKEVVGGLATQKMKPKLKTSHAKREWVRKRKLLEETARKLKLPSLKT